MKTGRRKIYWDNTCWIAWLNGEGPEKWPSDVIQGMKDVVAEVELGNAILFTSAITRTELPEDRLTTDQKLKLDLLMRRSNVREVNADPRVTKLAGSIREYHKKQKPARSVHTPDAIHLATAIIYEADEFQTMDGLQKDGSTRKLLKLSGDVGGHDLKVVIPYPRHTPPDELKTIAGPLFEKDS